MYNTLESYVTHAYKTITLLLLVGTLDKSRLDQPKLLQRALFESLKNRWKHHQLQYT